MSTFLVYKVKKCLLKSGKVNLRRVKYCHAKGNILPRSGTKRNVGTEKNILQDDYFFLVRESPHLVKEQIENPKTTNTERAKTSF